MRSLVQNSFLAAATLVLMSAGAYGQTSTQTLTLEVKGMACQSSCANGIDSKLSETKGIESSKTSFEEGTSVITFDPEIISQKKIIKIIAARGFTAAIKEGTTSCDKKCTKSCCKK